MNSKEKKSNLTNTLLKTSSSMPNIFTKTKLNLKDFGLFTKYIDKQLSFYNLEPKELGETHTIFNKTGMKLGRNEKIFLNMMKARNPMYNLKNDQNSYNNTFMTVSIKNNYYENPLHSLNILKKNSHIAHDIVKKNLYRQKSVFNDTIKRIKLNKVFYKKKMPFMKISTLMPNLKKDYVFLSLKNTSINNNNNNENNNKSNNNKNVESDNNNKPKKIKNTKSYKVSSDRFVNPYTKLICLYRYSHKNFPESREQFSLLLNENTLYLIGGKSCIFTQEELWTCDLTNISWSKIKSTNGSFVRFGHTAVFDKNYTKIFIYGGRTKYDQFPETKLGEKTYGFCGIEYYDFKTKEFGKPVMSYRIQPDHRRNHVAELIGNDLVIMGGINENNDILNDVYSLNLNFPNGIKERWKEVDIVNTMNVETPFLFGHASALAVQGAVAKCNKFSLYKYPDDERIYKLGVLIDKIKIKGLYIFGGKSRAIGTTGLSNELYVLVVGKKPCFWRKLDDAKGVKPTPRFFHSMSYYERGNFLIIHGGRNDLNNDSFALNDTFIFDLEFLEWHRVVLYSNIEGFKVMPRCAHKSVVHNNRLIIFGGMNNQNYIGSCLFIIRLDPDSFEKNRMMVTSENGYD